MAALHHILILLGASTLSSAFWWGSSTQDNSQKYPTHFYPRVIHAVAEPVPVQVPIQPHLAPTPPVQNVQLVPCLCTVAPEYDKVPQDVYITAAQNKAK